MNRLGRWLAAWCAVGCAGALPAGNRATGGLSRGSLERSDRFEEWAFEPRIATWGGPPRVVLSGTGVRVDGALVASTTPLQTRKLDSLFRHMSPLGKVEGEYALVVLGDSDGASLKSVMATMALAGFSATKLETERGAVVVQTRLPSSSGLDLSQRLVLRVQPAGIEVSQWQRRAQGWVEQSLGNVSAARLEAELPPLLERHCTVKNSCRPLLLQIKNEASYALVERVIAAAAVEACGPIEGDIEIELRIALPAEPRGKSARVGSESSLPQPAVPPSAAN